MRIAAIVVVVSAVVAAAGSHASVTSGFFELDLVDATSRPLPWVAAGDIIDLSPGRTQVLYRNLGTLSVAGVDGSSPRRIVAVPHQIHGATWSPDGRTIAFELADTTGCGFAPPRCGRFQIWLVGRSGGNLRKLADDAREPAWSPDSRRLAFVGDFDTPTLSGTVAIANVDGSGRRALTAREEAREPRWSRDGRFLAYTRVLAKGNRDAVRVVEVRRPERARTVARGDGPFWVASGGLAFTRHLPNSRDGLYVADDGARRPRQVAVAGEITATTASLDGRRVAYGAPGSLVVITAGGRRLGAFPLGPMPGGARVGPIFWSRDGGSVLYVQRSSARVHGSY